MSYPKAVETVQSQLTSSCKLTDKCKILIRIFILALISVECVPAILADPANNKIAEVEDQNNSSQLQEYKLNCQAGEQRLFNYESSTRIWNSDAQQVRIRASLKLRCMEAPSNTTLKYLVEVLDVVSEFRGSNSKRYRTTFTPSNGKKSQSEGKAGKLVVLGLNQARAEPIFEEVGEVLSETAERVRKSVSGWFSKTWISMKDFFVNIFNPSEKSISSREEVLSESGVDISGQCKATASARKHLGGASGLPIDDSMFDDLAEPEYYMSASLDPLAAGPSYQFNNLPTVGESTPESEQQAMISFFDDPKRVLNRAKRGTSSGKKSTELNQEKLLRIPFVLIQAQSGKVIEIRFSETDVDVGVKNFKRHLCDLFATNLANNKTKSELNELSPLGKHTTKYQSSTNATRIEQTLVSELKAAGKQQDAEQSRLLVKVLASTGLRKGSYGDDEGRSSSSANNDDGSQDNHSSLSVLRTINSTSQLELNSRTPNNYQDENQQVQVNVQQFQQINDGRMTGSAGQLSMSLLDTLNNNLVGQQSKRNKRSTASEDQQAAVDMGDLMKVTSSFSIQLVPLTKVGFFPDPLDLSPAVDTSSKSKRLKRATAQDQPLKISETKTNKTTRVPLVSRPPIEQGELKRTLDEWRQLETRLRFKPSSIQSEQAISPSLDNQVQRLDLLRDQIQMRINEQFLSIRYSRVYSSAARDSSPQSVDGGSNNELGFSLSQLVLDSSSSISRRKGSMASTIEEALELEWLLNEENEEGSISRLLRETARLDKLSNHCKGAILSPQQLIRAKSSKSDHNKAAISEQIKSVERQMAQCKQVLGVLIRANQRAASELAVDLLDLCNENLLGVAREEELGYGPASRYYRQLRQQFIELLGGMHRPSESLIDKLLARLPPPVTRGAVRNGEQRRTSLDEQQEFSFVTPSDTSKGGESVSKRPTWSKTMTMLATEDDHNSDEASGALIMTLTSLAAKPSVGRAKKIELIEKLLDRAKRINPSCSDQLSGVDLDTLEAMGNFEEPFEELANKIVNAAKRCPAHSEQLLLACVHGMQGQLELPISQRFLADLLRSKTASCTLKSEILFVLLSAHQNEQLRRFSSPSKAQSTVERGSRKVPSTLDRVLTNIMQSSDSTVSRDRRCLSLLISKYLSLRRPQQQTSSLNDDRLSTRRTARKPRAIPNDDGFWDEAQCKRWSVPLTPNSSGQEETDSNSSLASGNDLVDEFDDNSIASAIASVQSQPGRNSSARGLQARTQSQRLIERENELSNNFNSSMLNIRRRQKCVASKSIGPKNAQASIKAELVNELVGTKDENKFLARFRLATHFMGRRFDIGRMYLWHQRQTTRAQVNILGKSLWDTARGCGQRLPSQIHYMPMFDFSLWLMKLSIGIRLHSQMGFFSDCPTTDTKNMEKSGHQQVVGANDELELFPSVNLRASAEASAKFVLARAGISVAGQYGYRGNIHVSKQPESCMNFESSHQPMNLTVSSWFQLWDGDCHYWGSRGSAEPQAVKWKITAKKPSIWLQNECLLPVTGSGSNSSISEQKSGNWSKSWDESRYQSAQNNIMLAT